MDTLYRSASRTRTDIVAAMYVRAFAWMFVGMLVSGGVAAWLASSSDMTEFFTQNTATLIGLIVAQFALVIGLGWGLDRMSVATAQFMFVLFCGVTGMTLSVVLEAYTPAVLWTAFAGAAGVFGGMAVYGAVTKRDLTRFGGLLFGALIGLIVVSFAHILVGGAVLNLLIGIAGVIIFAGYTAYDMQVIREQAYRARSEDEARKLAIFGALALYLDFLNLFLSLLRIFGASSGD